MSVRRVMPDVHGERPVERRAFYEDVIGLELRMDLGWIATFVSPSNDTAQLSVMSGDARAPVAQNVSVEVADVDAVRTKAVAGGYEIVYPPTDEPWGVRRLFVRDPNGAVVNVVQHR
jgi:predicted enzyme related to lactoylglutathione lyase